VFQSVHVHKVAASTDGAFELGWDEEREDFKRHRLLTSGQWVLLDWDYSVDSIGPILAIGATAMVDREYPAGSCQ